MTSLSRGGSTAKKATSAAEAPIWKLYLAIRSSTSDVNASNTADQLNKTSSNIYPRGRKRSKPLISRGGMHGPGAGIWMTLGTPLMTSGHSGGEFAVLHSVRHYWEQLSANERQQILFLDEPELVKQLYKLNLSLLCVGLMQRHLKTSNRTATDIANNSKKVVATAATMTTSNVAPTTSSTGQERAAARSTTDTSSEKTYELLEAMEFMDIGTGILTVKTELAEDTDRLFTLVGDVLEGFLTSIHVLTESNFNKLFVVESETINTWANYQRLIAMLVEQLILRSYAIHLEKEAALQMEQLLLEVSLEDKAKEHNASATCSKKKSKKKKKRKKAAGHLAPQPDTTRDQVGHVADYADRSDALGDPNGDVMDEPAPEPTPKLKSIDSDCRSNSSTGQSDEIVVEENEAMPVAVESFSKKSTGLNPNAVAFQPQENVIDSVDSRNPFAGKRKFDEYIVSVPWEDVESEADSAFDTLSFDSDFSDREEVVDFGDSQQWRRKQRRHEEDAELEWQLQQVYASTSSLFGWDFSRQCELPTSGANLPWSESMLWRTAPKEVVRYFSSGNRDAYSRFHAPQFLPPSACLPPSRYYFHPGSSVPFGPPLLAPPAMESIPQHLHSTFGFQSPEFPMVVSSPDFSNAQYHSNSHEDQVDV